MKESNELFELCKKCYEATGWECNGNQYLRKGHYFDSEGNEYHPGEPYLVWFASKYDRDFPEEWLCPLYTSDYLLEKLQEVGFNDGPSQGLVLEYVHKGHGKWGWKCHFPGYYYKYGNDEWIGFDPIVLKALLKLTLKLHEEKVL